MAAKPLSEIIVGVDYGTTHSGVSWAFTEGERTVNLITNWPVKGSQIASNDKVPSELCYHDNGELQAWGYTVPDTATAIAWVKLLLEPDYRIRTVPAAGSHEALIRAGKSPETAVSNYLTALWSFVLEQLRRKIGQDFERTFSIRVVLTCPAIWSDLAKHKTLSAAYAAGMPRTRTTLVPEPEAAALAVLKERNDHRLLQNGDVVVVCDAGGGTVDLISYEIKQISPLKVAECAQGDGDACGSTILDDRFRSYIKYHVGHTVWRKIPLKYKKKMMREFESRVKRIFDGTNEDLAVDLKGVGTDEEKDIVDDTINLRLDALKTIFEGVALQIITLIERQINAVKTYSSKLKAKALILVGGFGESPFLYSRLSQEFRSQGLEVLQPIGAWSAITRGATLWGLENPISALEMTDDSDTIVASRIARHSYGLRRYHAFDRTRHDSKDMFIDVDGKAKARNQMSWLVKKGDTIQTGELIESPQYQYLSEDELLVAPSIEWSSDLYYCDLKDPPMRWDESSCRSLCTLHYTIPKTAVIHHDHSLTDSSTGKKYRKVNSTALMTCGTSVEFAVQYRGQIVGTTEATYAD